MKGPGPDRPITIERTVKRVRVSFASKVIADSRRVLTLNEAGYNPVHYIPRADIDMRLLHATTHHTHCPYRAMPAILRLAPTAAAPTTRCGATSGRFPPSP